MKSLACLALLLCLSTASLGLGTIQKVSLRPSECNNCGMTALGQLNLKICGGTLPEVCCSIVNIANFQNINEGIDGGQLDYVEVSTSDSSTVRCNLGFWLDEFD